MGDFYSTLGVSKNADAKEIKSAYRKVAMKFHPDKNPGDLASEEKFKEAAEAYSVLSLEIFSVHPDLAAFSVVEGEEEGRKVCVGLI